MPAKITGASQDGKHNVQKTRKFVGIGSCKNYAYDTAAGKRMGK